MISLFSKHKEVKTKEKVWGTSLSGHTCYYNSGKIIYWENIYEGGKRCEEQCTACLIIMLEEWLDDLCMSVFPSFESYLLNMILFLSTMMFDIVLETIHSKF